MSQVHTPSPFVGDYPFENVEGNLFTPVCLRTHWDPTEMLRHIIPQQKVGLPQHSVSYATEKHGISNGRRVLSTRSLCCQY